MQRVGLLEILPSGELRLPGFKNILVFLRCFLFLFSTLPPPCCAPFDETHAPVLLRAISFSLLAVRVSPRTNARTGHSQNGDERRCTQECAVLLIHGRRAAYFPSPYVDAYGERQRHTFRGRPLFLDQRRYNVVRGLWVKHLVAHEVCMYADWQGGRLLVTYGTCFGFV